MTAALGRLVRDQRQQHGWSQMELAGALGWKGASSRVSDLEQGNTIADRKLVDSLALIFGVDSLTCTEWYMSAGLLPDICEMENAIKHLKSELDRWTSPAYLLDFSWRLLAWNAPAEEVLGFDGDRASKENPNILDLIFDDAWQTRGRIVNWEKLATRQIEGFYLDQLRQGTVGQRWYQSLIVRLMQTKGFTEKWNAIVQKSRSEIVRDKVLEGLIGFTVTFSLGKKQVPYGIVCADVAFDARLRIAFYAQGVVFGDQRSAAGNDYQNETPRIARAEVLARA